MQLLINTEVERELACGLTAANDPGVDDVLLEEVGAWMTGQAMTAVRRAGFEIQRAHSQKVGSFVIFQDGTEEERNAWESAIAGCRDKANRWLAENARLVAAATE